MKKFLRETKYVLIFFLLLTVATALSFVDVNSDKTIALSPAEIMKTEVSFNNSGDNKNTDEVQRRPATVTGQKQSLHFSVFCDSNKKNRLETNQQFIMLNLSSCDEVKSPHHIWLKNETNGFKAQIFKANGEYYKTDFIQLNSGLNKIIIEAVLKNGQKREQSLEILSGF